jgi:hypothetical protein
VNGSVLLAAGCECSPNPTLLTLDVLANVGEREDGKAHKQTLRIRSMMPFTRTRRTLLATGSPSGRLRQPRVR